MKVGANKFFNSQRGSALPLAMFMTLTLALVGGITAKVSQLNARKILISESTQDTFQVAEGSAHDVLGQIATTPELWRELNPLEDEPYGYTEYNPADYADTNGIPTCSGKSCHRNYYPIGGGLVKNFGPLSSDGSAVDTSYSITEQFDEDNPVEEDIVLNSLKGWTQVERLEEIIIDSSSVGGGLENNKSAGSKTGLVRFRLSSIAKRVINNEAGRSTLVMVIEVPAT